MQDCLMVDFPELPAAKKLEQQQTNTMMDFPELPPAAPPINDCANTALIEFPELPEDVIAGTPDSIIKEHPEDHQDQQHNFAPAEKGATKTTK